ncbi:hypothetical protein GCM10010460_06820 [Microbacterium terrae]|nr:hypothetical protein GCM10017594_04400 [Microbacterium terrae]
MDVSAEAPDESEHAASLRRFSNENVKGLAGADVVPPHRAVAQMRLLRLMLERSADTR